MSLTLHEVDNPTAFGRRSWLNDVDWRGKYYSSGWRGSSRTAEITDKATRTVLASVGIAGAADVVAAADTACMAQRIWMSGGHDDRAGVFRKAVRLLEEGADAIVPWIMRETGGIKPKAEAELRTATQILEASAAMIAEPQGLVLSTTVGRMSLARKQPHGVVGVISPFNFPLILGLRAVAPALAAGNAVILKPDSRTAVTGGVVIARLFEAAGLPEGVLHMLPGDAEIGEQICCEPNIAMIAFTGSTRVGRRVGELCGRHLKPMSLELGGNNTMIVLKDADIDLAARCAAFGTWLHQGQICMATGRIIAVQPIAAELVARLVRKANRLRVGNPMTQRVLLGPLIDERHAQHVQAIVRESVVAGAILEAGGGCDGPFHEPTVLSGVRPGMRAFDEEIFGPVASVTTVASEEEAVDLANRTEYGLTGSVFGSLARALSVGERLNVGVLHINEPTVHDEVNAPFGGRGASGNGSRLGGPANWQQFTQWQWITMTAA